jgi:hypothetical protein
MYFERLTLIEIMLHPSYVTFLLCRVAACMLMLYDGRGEAEGVHATRAEQHKADIDTLRRFCVSTNAVRQELWSSLER